MSRISKIVETLIQNRKQIPQEHLPHVCLFIFRLALRDPDAAELIVSTQNRITLTFKHHISASSFIQFAGLYPELREKLIQTASLDPQMANLIRKTSPRPNNDMLLESPMQLDGRTHAAVLKHNLIKEGEELYIMIKGERYPVVNRYTRNFNRLLLSVGVDKSREIIKLDPSSQKLQALYTTLIKQIGKSKDINTYTILQKVSAVTQQAFPGVHTEQIKHAPGQVIPLDDYLEEKQGACRHHALLNAYLLSRLVEDGKLQGDVFSHRQDIVTPTGKRGAHNWNVFKDATTGKLYSLDSLWNSIIDITSEAELASKIKFPHTLDLLYGPDTKDKIIKRYAQPQKNKGENWLAVDEHKVPNLESILSENIDLRIRLTGDEMSQLKAKLDQAINTELKESFNEKLNLTQAGLPENHKKLTNIPVRIEKIGSQYLVKVGPCDLSGVGGHTVREAMIKNLVNQALRQANLPQKVQFENVAVSACVGVRGRGQMIKGFFRPRCISSPFEEDGSHMNAYVKTSTEKNLTHWEPRNGPQKFYNTTICALVVSVVTSLFEKGIRENKIPNSQIATQTILQNTQLQKIVDKLLKLKSNIYNTLTEELKTFSFQSK